MNQFSRTELLLGNEAMKKLRQAKVAIFGVGGVGSFAVEALARSGVENFVLFDDDKVCLTNINRQLIATLSSVGREKVEVCKERILDINKNAKVETNVCFYSAQNADDFDFSTYSYIVDAIDTVTSKLLLIEKAKQSNTPIISSMGAGNKLDPTKFEVTDIKNTSVCPLAKVMRKELKTRCIENLKVVYSKEIPIKPIDDGCNNCKSNCICPPNTSRKCTDKRQIPGSVSFVPSVVGLIIGGEVVKDLIKDN